MSVSFFDLGYGALSWKVHNSTWDKAKLHKDRSFSELSADVPSVSERELDVQRRSPKYFKFESSMQKQAVTSRGYLRLDGVGDDGVCHFTVLSSNLREMEAADVVSACDMDDYARFHTSKCACEFDRCGDGRVWDVGGVVEGRVFRAGESGHEHAGLHIDWECWTGDAPIAPVVDKDELRIAKLCDMNIDRFAYEARLSFCFTEGSAEQIAAAEYYGCDCGEQYGWYRVAGDYSDFPAPSMTDGDLERSASFGASIKHGGHSGSAGRRPPDTSSIEEDAAGYDDSQFGG